MAAAPCCRFCRFHSTCWGRACCCCLLLLLRPLPRPPPVAVYPHQPLAPAAAASHPVKSPLLSRRGKGRSCPPVPGHRVPAPHPPQAPQHGWALLLAQRIHTPHIRPGVLVVDLMCDTARGLQRRQQRQPWGEGGGRSGGGEGWGAGRGQRVRHRQARSQLPLWRPLKHWLPSKARWARGPDAVRVFEPGMGSVSVIRHNAWCGTSACLDVPLCGGTGMEAGPWRWSPAGRKVHPWAPVVSGASNPTPLSLTLNKGRNSKGSSAPVHPASFLLAWQHLRLWASALTCACPGESNCLSWRAGALCPACAVPVMVVSSLFTSRPRVHAKSVKTLPQVVPRSAASLPGKGDPAAPGNTRAWITQHVPQQPVCNIALLK